MKSPFVATWSRFLACAIFASLGSLLTAQTSWTSADIGAVAAAGSSSETGGVVTVRGSGADIWDQADEFHFRYVPWSGDGAFVVRVTGITNTHAWAKAGVMIRSSLSPASAHVFANVNPNRIASRIFRTTSGGDSLISAQLADVDRFMPMWLKLTREGGTIAAYFSRDGVAWTVMGQGTFAFPSTVFVGLAVSSHVDGTICTGTFDKLSFTGNAPGQLSAIAHAPTRVDLSWTHTTPTATGHEIERSMDNVSFARVATTGTGLSYSDNTASPSTSYYYRVRALSPSGPSGYTNSAAATTPPPSPPGWNSEDIGATSVTGRSTLSGSTFTLVGSGEGVGGVDLHHVASGRGDFNYDVVGYSDEFQFCYKPWSGDGEIVARLTGVGSPSGAQAGIMVRGGTGASALSVFYHVRAGGGGLAVLSRPGTATDGRFRNESTYDYQLAPGTPPPTWLKLVRNGGGVMSYASSDGVNWTELVWVRSFLPTDIQLGLGVSSREDGDPSTGALPATTTAMFDNVRVGTVTLPVPPPPAPTGLTISSIGSDSVSLAWQNHTTNYDYIEVERSTDGTNFTRESFSNLRGTTYTNYLLEPTTTYHYRVRMTRGTTVSGYSNTVTVSISGSAQAPSALTATATSATTIQLDWADNTSNENAFQIFRSVDGTTFTIVAEVGPNVTSYTDATVSASTTYRYRVRARLGSFLTAFSNDAAATTPAEVPTGPVWQSQDIGSVAATGSASESGGVLTLRGSGADIWGTADEFRYRFQAWSGAGEIIARITGLTNTNAWAKAGLMFRESLAPGARHAFVCATVGHGVGLQTRLTTGGESMHTTGTSSTMLPTWLRLVRSGSTFTAYQSTNGTTWNLVGTHTLNLPSDVYVGFAVTSHNDGVLCTATFDNITVAPSAEPPPPPPPSALTPPSGLAVQVSAGNWINLSWSDNSSDETGFEVERSNDGVTFAPLGPATANTTAFVDATVVPSTLYYYRVRATRNAERSAYSSVASARTDTPWLVQNIGAVAASGSISGSGSAITLDGSGADIWNTADEFRFHHQRLTGDGEIVARVASLANTNGWAKAGVMFRESLSAASRHAFMCVSATHGMSMQRRTVTGGESSSTPGSASSAPMWVRLARSGNSFSAYESTNGTTWTLLGSQTFDFPATVYVGLAVTSHNDGVICRAAFDNIVVRGGTTPPPATPPAPPSGLTARTVSSSHIEVAWDDNSNNETGFEVESSGDNATFTRLTTTAPDVRAIQHVGLPQTTTFFYRVRAINAAGASAYSNVASATTDTSSTPPPGTWTNSDIGGVALAGGSSGTGPSFSVSGSGSDIWETSDEFHYMHQPWSGDGVFVARVTSITPTHTWAKAGIMLRETLAPNSRHVMVCVNADNDGAFLVRNATGALTTSTLSVYEIPQMWIKLTRAGNTFTAHQSADGVTWVAIGAPVTVNLPSSLFAGLAVTSHNDGVLCTAAFENVSFTPASGTPPPSTWSRADVGAVGVTGSDEASGNTITIRGSGADIWGTADAFRFVYRVISGDCTVEAQVTSLTNTNGWAKAGVMIRESLARDARNVFALVTPSNGVGAQVRTTPGGQTSSTPGPWGAAIPYWVRLVRTGGTVVAYSSPNGTNWTQVATFSVGLNTTTYVGFAVTSHNNSTTATAIFADPFIEP